MRESTAESIYKIGYFVNNPVLTTTEINSLRHQLDELFAKRGNPKELCLWEIEDDESEIWMRILELFQDKQSTTIMQELSNFMGVEVSLLPSFNIQRNMSINRLISSSSGWHPNCGGETSY